jgi:hypothetical protein
MVMSSILKQARFIALFVSRFSPEFSADDADKPLKGQLSLKKLVCKQKQKQKKLRRFSPQANYTDRANAACLRS